MEISMARRELEKDFVGEMIVATRKRSEKETNFQTVDSTSLLRIRRGEKKIPENKKGI